MRWLSFPYRPVPPPSSFEMAPTGPPQDEGTFLEKHEDKTFIGRIERGFDFLGYHFGPAGLAVAKQTIANFIEKATRLYGQERRAAPAASPGGSKITP